ncbi:glycosyltransferase [Modestobacter sp. VKM Ac-2977]|uniref:glycosyltransferase family 2 protein n=1 Tax=Modestobacter sp. VKM Ac-2977 TaxID=3004131 RepID=UPI0022AABB2C|nr:glycosyltransferase [Modestobacter sp. VKM Ac-2977]MCZ2822752.1 glycosyltransferase [Modestobacter sp. VKM Ac-2977]
MLTNGDASEGADEAQTVAETHAGPRSVSIVVCSRDRPDQLAQSLAAIGQVRLPGDQLIVVDSASGTPDTQRVAHEGGADVVVRCELKGLSRARNAGLRASTADVVVFTDDDCRPETGWIEGLLEGLSADDAVVATGAVVPLGEGFLSGMTHATGERQTHPIATNPLGHGANMAMRRQALEDIGGFDEQLGAGAPLRAADDWDVFLRLLRTGGALVYVPGAVVRHEQWRATSQALRVRLGYSMGAGALAVKCWRLGGAADQRQARLLLGSRLREGAMAVVVGIVTLRWFRTASGLVTLVGATRGLCSALLRRVDDGHLSAPRTRWWSRAARLRTGEP